MLMTENATKGNSQRTPSFWDIVAVFPAEEECIERSTIDAERELNGAKQRDLVLTWLTAYVQGLLACACSICG